MNNNNIKKTILIIFSFNIFGCSTFNNIIYQPTINQGNYFYQNDLIKINIGMNKEEITSILGTPMLHDPFGSNTYYYIFYKKLHNKKTIQKTLTLTFDNNDALISINHETF